LAGKRVENAPRYIHNFGISWSKKPIFYDLTIQNIRKKFTDANNTTTPSATGVIGLLEGYTVMDLSAEYKFPKNYNLRSGINNLTDETYATRRAEGTQVQVFYQAKEEHSLYLLEQNSNDVTNSSYNKIG
jgi:Fe(3+) dicitrate transport protein